MGRRSGACVNIRPPPLFAKGIGSKITAALSVVAMLAGLAIAGAAVADGYADYKPSFTVKLSENGNTFNDANDPWDLFNKDTHEVTSVKNATELPLTGAAGITMFLVLAVALDGLTL